MKLRYLVLALILSGCTEAECTPSDCGDFHLEETTGPSGQNRSFVMGGTGTFSFAVKCLPSGLSVLFRGSPSMPLPGYSLVDYGSGPVHLLEMKGSNALLLPREYAPEFLERLESRGRADLTVYPAGHSSFEVGIEAAGAAEAIEAVGACSPDPEMI